jgi:dihydropyrimidinase
MHRGDFGMPSTLIRGGEVVHSEGVESLDVRLIDGSIGEVAHGLTPMLGESVIEADGLLVLPGLIDCHTHFGISRGDMESLDDFAKGSISAAAGGVTTYLNFAPQEAEEPLTDALRRHLAMAEGQSVVDYGVHMSFGTPSPAWEQELSELVARGVTSLKVYTTYRDSDYYTRDYDWLQLMRAAASEGLTVMVHAENDDIVAGHTRQLLAEGKRSFAWHGEARPPIAELEGVARGLVFSHDTGCPIYFVHLTNPEAVALVQEARGKGVRAYAETCPHYVTLDSDNYRRTDAARFVMTPPLREKPLVDRLARQLAEGELDTVASDHCGYSLAQRGDAGDFTASSPGIPGVETLWPILFTELVANRGVPITSAVGLVSKRPAQIFGLTRKGRIAPGFDADIVLLDPEARSVLDDRRLHSGAGYSPWHGARIAGRIVRTMSRGVTVYDGEEVVGKVGHGKFVRRVPGTTSDPDDV